VAMLFEHPTMAKFILTLIVSFSLTHTFGQLKPKGIFIGLVPIKNFSDPAKPQYKWYHLSELTFKGDSIYLEQSPIAIHKNDTIISASDGGFYYYAGTIQFFKGQTVADLTLTTCDYCPNQFIKFIPPKLVRDVDSSKVTTVDTTTTFKGLDMIENTSIKYKTLFLEATKRKDVVLVDGIVYRRQNRK
jgi:hypothetical protein